MNSDSFAKKMAGLVYKLFYFGTMAHLAPCLFDVDFECEFHEKTISKLKNRHFVQKLIFFATFQHDFNKDN